MDMRLPGNGDAGLGPWWRRNRGVWLAAGGLILFLLLIATAALLVLAYFWTQGGAAAGDPRALEVVKVCMQVIGVGVIGAFVTVGAATLESARRERAERERARRESRAAEDVQHREEFEIRSALMDRTTRCAQAMFVTCQHVRRMQKDAESAPIGAGRLRRRARRLLDEEYLSFATEARALESLIMARYTSTPSPDDRGGPSGHETAVTGTGMPGTGEARTGIRPGQAWWRWHQIYDLLTVYYFSLTGTFRVNVLRTNSRGHEGAFHAGIEFRSDPFVVNGVPDHAKIEKAIRDEFAKALREFTEALRTERARDV